MRFLALLFITVLFVASSCEDDDPMIIDRPDYDPTPYSLDYPSYLPIMEIPEDNPMTEEGVSLGRMLFYDPILSADSTLSCAGCHKMEYSFTDERQFSVGIDGSVGTRQAMHIVNIGWMPDLFWDGRSQGLEAQALEPVINPIEMMDTWPNVVNKLSNHDDYPDLFWAAFGEDQITKEQVVKAIAQFERTMISGDSRYDLIVERNEGFFTDAELEGFEIFNTERGDCFHCHGGILFTDNLFHNNGLDSVFPDIGLEEVTGDPLDRGLFKTPGLRNIELTAPYMHDGRFETLEEVIDHYSEGLVYSETIDPLMKQIAQGGIQLTDQEKASLLAFLKTLTDTSFINNPAFKNPFED
ncbi:MAG: cytochrome-c peroxidase [Bacteroidetes bacterium]|nr:MAG: cytochrome-c peroxidase [Bacteroidota bacterium]